MRLPVSMRLALRNVLRNGRRTAISVAGIGVGVGMALLISSLNRARGDLYARAAAESGAGHIQVAPRGWGQSRDPRLRLAGGARDLAAVRGLPETVAAAPRVAAEGLLALGSRVAGVEVVGVDAAEEPRVNRLARRVKQGRYLAPGERGAAVIGAGVADRLEAQLDDDLVVTVVGKGGRMQSAMLRVVGVVATGAEEIDDALCHAPFADVEALTGRPGIGEIAVLLRGLGDVPAARARTAQLVAPGDEVLGYAELVPDLAGHVAQESVVLRVMNGIVVLVVLLGLASAQLTAALERRRELAVLAAIGMSPRRIAATFLAEALVLGLAGALAALAVGGPLALWFSRHGLDLTSLWRGQFSFQGLLIEPVLYASFGPWIAGQGFALALLATLVASLYPAWFAARVDAGAALRTVP